MNFIKFILIYFLWFLSSCFLNEQNLYQTLILPNWAPKPYIFGVIWPILYFLITLSIILTTNKNNTSKNYYISLTINYFLNQFFSIIFFNYQNLFLSFVCCLFVFISSIYLFNETYNINKKASILLLPYIIWTLLATILSLSIYLLN